MLHLVSKKMPNDQHQQEGKLSQKRFQLAKLLRCTEEMLCFAQKGQWNVVEEMENFRKVEIKACFEDKSHSDSPLIAEALATLLNLNEQITNLVKQAKDDVIVSQKNMSSTKLAVNSYQIYQE